MSVENVDVPALAAENESPLTLNTDNMEDGKQETQCTSETSKDSRMPQTGQPCAHYAQGRCRFGDQCRFVHDPNITPVQSPASRSSSETSTPRSPNRHNQSSGGQQRYHHNNNNGHYMNNHQNNGSAHGGHFVQNRRFVQMAPSPVMLQPMNLPILINDAVPPPGTILSQPPPPVLVNLAPHIPVYSIDVECVATGVQHNARSVAQVALVDQWARPLFNVYIKQDRPVSSYLTELTGITKELLEERGIPLAEAMAQLRSFLSPHAILVGHSIFKDVQWLQLAQGMDYHSLINLSDLFRVWNMTHNSFTYFSQDHIASVWLQYNTEGRQHNAVTDAALAISLFNAYRTHQLDPNVMYEMQRRLLLAPRIKGFSANTPVLDGCCMGNRKNCICGAPFE